MEEIIKQRCTELKCDCGNTEDVKKIEICANCYNPQTGDWLYEW